MVVNIQFTTDAVCPLTEDQIKAAVEKTMRVAGAISDAELTVVLSDDDELHRLNLQFLGIDAPTDVLSFPADFVDPDSQHPYLGDILISVERALQQAEQQNHSAQQELRLLIVHGVLHLLGFDHAEAVDKERMWSLQNQIVSNLKDGEPN